MLMMPTLQSLRLSIRPFVMEDLPDVYQLLDVDLREVHFGSESMSAITERAEWLNWTILNYEQLAKLDQPPYGDRAVVLRSTGQLVGACGFVPYLNAFEQLPSFTPQGKAPHTNLYSTQFGLFYAISPSHQRQGYATEATSALVQYAFQQLRLGRIVATTDYDNAASIGVMRKIGMRIEHNPLEEPPWLQVVGILENL
jgi:RimJ/RimL family protein N-acetyltransferase